MLAWLTDKGQLVGGLDDQHLLWLHHDGDEIWGEEVAEEDGFKSRETIF